MNTKILRPPHRTFDGSQQNFAKPQLVKIYQNGNVNQLKHQGYQRNIHNAFPQQYPYDFNYVKNLTPLSNVQQINTHSHQPTLIANQRPVIINRPNSPSLQPSITSHANPMGVKNLYPILKQSGRPNSEDNKHQYSQTQKQQIKRRAQSQAKGQYKEGDTTVSFKQQLNTNAHPNKSPLKPPNHNQYMQAQGQCTKACTHNSLNASQTFLTKCLQHIMIQNNCLSKQMMMKELQLTRLRQELFKIKQRYLEFNSSNKFYPSENSNSSSSSQSYRNIHTESVIEQGGAKKLGEVRQEEDDQISEYSFAQNKESGSMQHHPNLQQIEQMIQQIEVEERKLMKKPSQSFDIRLSESKHIEQKEEKQQEIVKQITQPTPITKKNSNTNIDNDVNNWVEKDHKVEGMEFTRLDRLRMKKGLISRREQFDSIK